MSVSRLAPRLVSVLVGGEGMAGFGAPAPTSHVKVMLPGPGQDRPALPASGPDGPVWPEGAVRPAVRTYTPRRFDPASGTLEIQFALHGAGPASEWAERAQPGHRIGVSGPGGRFSLDPSARQWWIGGDESALPAIATLLEALPASARAEVHIEVGGPEDELALTSAARTEVHWHHRRRPDSWGVELLGAAAGASISADTQVWVACESVAVRRIRQHLLAERGLPSESIVTRGYWRDGEAGHPDHDYGQD